MDTDDENLSVSHYWNEVDQECEETLRKSGILPPRDHWISERIVVKDIDDLPRDVADACKLQLKFIETLKSNWDGESLAIPGAWKLLPGQIDQQVWPNWWLFRRLDDWLSLLSDDIEYLEDKDVKNPKGFNPEFCCSRSTDSIVSATQLPFAAFNEILDYDAQEASAEFIIPYTFQRVTRCQLRCHPGFDLPSCMSTEFSTRSIDFALVLNPDREAVENVLDPDQIKVSILRPALLVGIKGPAKWDHGRDVIYTSRSMQPTSLQESQETLCESIESTLYGLVATKRGNIDEDLVIFGVIYDAESVHIVAHMPYKAHDAEPHSPHDSYVSCIVDTIPYRGGYPVDKKSALDRLRVAMAMLCLRTHAQSLAIKLDPSNMWPEEVVRAAESVSSLYQTNEEEEEDDSDSEEDED